MQNLTFRRFVLASCILFVVGGVSGFPGNRPSDGSITDAFPGAGDAPVRQAQETKRVDAFENWLDETFVGKPLVCFLDHYQIPTSDVFPDGGHNDVHCVFVVPNDEEYSRICSVWIRMDVNLTDDNCAECWNRKVLGSGVILKFTGAVERQWDADDRASKEWDEVVRGVRTSRAQWRREMRGE
jgi:hypothetical protein